jgi:uncharacterized protein YutD
MDTKLHNKLLEKKENFHTINNVKETFEINTFAKRFFTLQKNIYMQHYSRCVYLELG